MAPNSTAHPVMVAVVMLLAGCAADRHRSTRNEGTAAANTTQIIDLSNAVISNVADVRIINIVGGVAGLPSGQYRSMIEMLDDPELAALKEQLQIVEFTAVSGGDRGLRIEPSATGWRTAGFHDVAIRNNSDVPLAVHGYGCLVAIFFDADGEQRLLIADDGVIQSSQSPVILPGKTGEISFDLSSTLAGLNRRAAQSGVTLAEGNYHFLAPHDGFAWRPNWPGRFGLVVVPENSP